MGWKVNEKDDGYLMPFDRVLIRMSVTSGSVWKAKWNIGVTDTTSHLPFHLQDTLEYINTIFVVVPHYIIL